MENLKQIISTTLTEDNARAAVLLICVVGIFVLSYTQHEIPQIVVYLTTLVVGYYFGRGVTNGKSKGGE